MNAGTTKRQHSNARETRCVLCGSTDSVERHHVGGRQHSRTGSSSHQTSRECQARLPRIPGGSANDSRLRSSPHDPEGASSMGSRRGSCSSDSVHRQPLRLGGLRTHDRSLATNLSAFETCNTTVFFIYADVDENVAVKAAKINKRKSRKMFEQHSRDGNGWLMW